MESMTRLHLIQTAHLRKLLVNYMLRARSTKEKDLHLGFIDNTNTIFVGTKDIRYRLYNITIDIADILLKWCQNF